MNVPSVYEWVCKTDATTHRYIGSTNNLQQRIWLHDHAIRSGDKNYFYDLIRATGGRDNWQCNQLEQLPTDISKIELRKREQHYIDSTTTPLINQRKAYLSPEALKKKQQAYYKVYYRDNIEKYNQPL
jgi:hypothetical protein